VLGLLGGNHYCLVFQVAMCVFGSLSWLCVMVNLGGNGGFWVFKFQLVLGPLGGNVCWDFEVAIFVAGSFRWQCVVFGLFGGNVCCCVFKWQCVV